MKRIYMSAAVIMLLTAAIDSVHASEKAEMNTQAEDSLMVITLNDGTQVEGYLVKEDPATLTILTQNGLQITINRSDIKSTEIVEKGDYDRTGRRLAQSQQYSRLLFAPTGRPMQKGAGYVSVHYIFFPGVGYGITDNVSLMGGFSLIPGIGLGQQLMYIAPRYGVNFNERFSGSAGSIFFTIPGEGGAGLLYAVGSYGTVQSHFTAGLAYGYVSDTGDINLSNYPIIMLGGAVSITRKLSFITENWFLTSADLTLMQQPLTVALRFFGDQLSFDVGFLIIGEIVKSGFPIPWLSAAYHF